MSRIAYIQCAAGVAGDMLLGALVDAGADPEEVGAAIARVGVDGYELTFERTQRCGIAATRANVVVGDSAGDGAAPDATAHGPEHDHRPAREIRDLLAVAELAEPVRRAAQSIFDLLALAEAAVHGIDADDVEFHEVGSVDAIVDVVGIAAALHSLGVDRIVGGPVATGHGTVSAAHGALPNPAPAVARLLASRAMPTFGIDTEMELATPTGVAVLAALAESFGAMPAMTVQAVGYGAGTADPAGRPNVVQVVIGQAADADRSVRFPGRPAIQLDVNVDDVTGEVLAHTIAALVNAGARDAWVTPVVMKKGRPAHVVSALCDPAHVEALAELLISETGSLGVRATTVQRWPQARTEAVVTVEGHRIAFKRAGGSARRVKIEHDDALVAATALGRPLRDVIAEAERLAHAER